MHYYPVTDPETSAGTLYLGQCYTAKLTPTGTTDTLGRPLSDFALTHGDVLVLATTGVRRLWESEKGLTSLAN